MITVQFEFLMMFSSIIVAFCGYGNSNARSGSCRLQIWVFGSNTPLLIKVFLTWFMVLGFALKSESAGCSSMGFAQLPWRALVISKGCPFTSMGISVQHGPMIGWISAGHSDPDVDNVSRRCVRLLPSGFGLPFERCV
jgi:ABC-type amino acid transport system permease subunit